MKPERRYRTDSNFRFLYIGCISEECAMNLMKIFWWSTTRTKSFRTTYFPPRFASLSVSVFDLTKTADITYNFETYLSYMEHFLCDNEAAIGTLRHPSTYCLKHPLYHLNCFFRFQTRLYSIIYLFSHNLHICLFSLWRLIWKKKPWKIIVFLFSPSLSLNIYI